MKTLAPFFCLLLAASPSAKSSRDLAPPDSLILMHLDVKENDPGQKWVFSELMRYLVSRSRRDEKPAEIGEISLFRFSDLCFAGLPLSKEKEEQMLMAARLRESEGSFGITYGGQQFRLNVRDEKGADQTQTGLLSMLLGIACKVPADNPPDNGIYYNPAGEKKGRFSAYSVTEERAILASNRDIIKRALSQESGLTLSPAYRETMGLLPEGWDAYGYAHNEGGALEKLFEENRKDWQTFILALLHPAKRMGLALDVLDRDRSRIVVVLPTDNPAQVKELRGKLEPALGLMVAQFLHKDIRSALKFEELPRALKIDAELSNTAPFWRKVFRVKDRASKPPSTGEMRNSSGPEAGEDPER